GSMLGRLCATWVFVCAGCSSSGSGTCGKVTACGGNVVGDWNVVDACLTFSGTSPLGDICPSATVDAGGLDASGTVSYRSDMTYSAMLTLSGSISINLPASCLTINNVTLTRAQLDQALKQQLIDNPSPDIQAVSCQGSGSCSCAFQMTPQTTTANGT